MRLHQWVGLVLAPGVVTAQQTIPIRQVAPIEAATTEKLDSRTSVNALSNGRVIVSGRGRVLAFEPDLKTYKLVVDSSGLTAGPGGRPPLSISLIPFMGDSTLVVDTYGRKLVVVDPAGTLGRAMPASNDASLLSLGTSTSLDQKGRLIYRGAFRPPLQPPSADGSFSPLAPPDTFPLIRADLGFRSVDTIATISAPSGARTSVGRADGKTTMKMTIQPLPVIDDWAVLADGSVAIVRGRDFHIDWISADGARRSTPKMLFEWRKVTDEEKQHIVDSVRAMDTKMQAQLESFQAARGGNMPSVRTERDYVAPSEMPDYYPPIRVGAVRADRDGNLWVLPTTPLAARGGLLYDVVNQKGEISERVQLPPACTLVGFAPKGVLYLVCGTTLSRTQIVR